MPTPKKNEKEQDFVSRCIPIVLKDGTAKDQKQASAICFNIFRERKKKMTKAQNTEKGEIRFNDLPMITDIKGFELGKEFKASDVPAAFQGMSLPPGRYLYGEPNAAIMDVQHDFIPTEVLFESLERITVPPYNKCFIHHDYVDIAIGKVVAKAIVNDTIYVLTKLNDNHRRADELWSSYLDGYIDAFSVGGTFLEWVPQYTNGVQSRKITRMITREISYTSMPVNEGGTIAGAFAKALGTKKREGENMKPQNNAQAPVNTQVAQGQATAPTDQSAAGQAQQPAAPAAAPAAPAGTEQNNAQKGAEGAPAPGARNFGAEIDALKGQMGDVLKGLDAVKDMIGKITTGGETNAQKGIQTPATPTTPGATTPAAGDQGRQAVKPVNEDQKGAATQPANRSKTPMTDKLMHSMTKSM